MDGDDKKEGFDSFFFYFGKRNFYVKRRKNSLLREAKSLLGRTYNVKTFFSFTCFHARKKRG